VFCEFAHTDGGRRHGLNVTIDLAFHGVVSAIDRVRAYPPAVQPELPVWLTSAGSTGTFKAAGVMGAGVLGQDLPTLAGNIAEYRSALGGRTGKVALMLHTFVGAGTDQVRAVVREPLRAYLASSTELFTGASAADGEDLDPALLEELLDLAFERYFTAGGLFGSVEHAAAMVQRVREIGVDEIACLVDFGIPPDMVIGNLVHLDQLRAASAI
jgi:natural product biosynthesis luciferase-like monooxygenase protein